MAIHTKLHITPDDDIRWAFTGGENLQNLANGHNITVPEVVRIISREWWPGRPLADLIRNDAMWMYEDGTYEQVAELYNSGTSQDEIAKGYDISVRAVWWAAETPHWDDPTSSDNWDEVKSWADAYQGTAADPRKSKIRRAIAEAKAILGMVQGTMGLEGQASTDPVHIRNLKRRIIRRLLGE